jgi:hypothetical protein
MTFSTGMRVFRFPDIWMDRNRLYKVVVDGRTEGDLWPEQVGFFSLAPGEHRIKVTIDSMTSNEVIVFLEADEIVDLACRGKDRATLLNSVFRRRAYLDLSVMTA